MEIKVAEAGGPIHYADFGGAGAPLVLVHGLGGSHLNWGLVGPALARSHRVVAPDLIGFGLTAPAGRSATVRHNVGALERFVMEVVGRPVTLVGNSMGGLISLLVAARRPDWVSSLVLVDPACPNPRFLGLWGLAIAAWAPLVSPGLGASALRRRSRRLGAEAVVNQVLKLVCTDPGRLPPEFRQAHVDLHTQRAATMPWLEDALVQAWLSLVPYIVRRGDYYDTLQRVAAPTLIVQGADDRVVPTPAVDQVAAGRPDWDYRVLPGVGHVPMMEVPEDFVAVLEEWMGALDRAEAV